MSLIDIGANLAHESFDTGRAAVLERAHHAGIEVIVITGSCAESSRKALELAKHYFPPNGVFAEQSLSGAKIPRLHATAGLHPHHASQWNAEHSALFKDLGQQKRVVALGECGLDYFRDLSPRADQRRAFTAQLKLAVELEKPVFLHQRDAHSDFLPILRDFRSNLTDAVVHCFTDTEAALDDYLELDCYIGITGWICDERRGQNLRMAVKQIPADRLLLETDAPYLRPRDMPRAVISGARGATDAGGRNEPGNLPWVARAVAHARGESVGSVAQSTSANARRFFRLSSDV